MSTIPYPEGTTVQDGDDIHVIGNKILYVVSQLSASGGGGGTLTPATTSTLGGVIVGSGLSVTSDGTLSTTGGGSGAVDSVFGRTGAVVANTGDYTAAQVTGALVSTNNLSDVSSVSTARTNLGLGSAALASTSDFDASGAAAAVQSASLQKSSNLSDLSSASTARTNLGLGTASTQSTSAFLQPSNNLSDVSSASTSRTNLGLAGANKRIIGFVLDSGDSNTAITTGTRRTALRFPLDGTITKWTLLADQAGSVVLDIWKAAFASFPPTVSDSITASAKPTLSSARTSESSTLTGWTTAVSSGDTFLVNVDSSTLVSAVTLLLEITTS